MAYDSVRQRQIHKGKAVNIGVSYSPQQARKLLLWLLGIEVLFAAAHLLTQFPDPVISHRIPQQLFDVSGEVSIPTWFSSTQLFVVAVVFFIAAKQNRRRQRVPSTFLSILGLGFLFLSVDEAAAIHEKVTGVAREFDASWIMFTGDHGAWIALYSVLGVVILWMLRHYIAAVWRHYRREAAIFAIGAVVLLMGALGLEILGYEWEDTAKSEWLLTGRFALEEFLEMVGVSIMLYAALLLTTAITSRSSEA